MASSRSAVSKLQRPRAEALDAWADGVPDAVAAGGAHGEGGVVSAVVF